jgi:maleylpyruvate isomerase
MDSDPDRLQRRISEATQGLLGTAIALTDDQAREPSLLPGWSRGHVLSHVARNADGLRNLLSWARTGVQTPQYPSRQARDAAIEAGAGRTAAELAADLDESAARFAAAAANLAGGAWDAEVRGLVGSAHPAWFVLFRRLTEVQVHHADLGLGYGPPDWPALFVTDLLDRVLRDFGQRDDVPACVLACADTGRRLRLGPASQVGDAAATTVSGPEHALLAWLIGRDAGNSLSVTGGHGAQHPEAGQDCPPPKLPPWG